MTERALSAPCGGTSPRGGGLTGDRKGRPCGSVKVRCTGPGNPAPTRWNRDAYLFSFAAAGAGVCHCEERSDAAIRVFFCGFRDEEKGNGFPQRPAAASEGQNREMREQPTFGRGPTAGVHLWTLAAPITWVGAGFPRPLNRDRLSPGNSSFLIPNSAPLRRFCRQILCKNHFKSVKTL